MTEIILLPLGHSLGRRMGDTANSLQGHSACHLPLQDLVPTPFTALHKHSCPKPATMAFVVTVPCFNQPSWDTAIRRGRTSYKDCASGQYRIKHPQLFLETFTTSSFLFMSAKKKKTTFGGHGFSSRWDCTEGRLTLPTVPAHVQGLLMLRLPQSPAFK